MLFNSFQFVVFLAVALAAFWSLPPRWRVVFLWAASYVFYGFWDYRFVGLLFLTTVVDFFAARAIRAATDPWRRKLFLLTSLSANLGVLGFFKYFNFFADSARVLLMNLGIPVDMGTLHVILPVGISFYTFQSMAYTIDVYRREVEPSRDFITFAAYVSFFPQLVAGPIERFAHLYPQLLRLPAPTAAQLRAAIFLLLQGYVKKVVVADGIAPVVNEVFGNIEAYNSGQLLEAAILFTCEIYCDFSGYSDIARGVALCFGVDLIENFRAPLLSRSITEFWRRWHISLSHWLRDYLYIPLGGNRHGQWNTYRNLMLTMLLGGLWHGADWKFVVWGGLHGLLLAIERFTLFRGGRHELPPPTRRTWPQHALLLFSTQLAVVLIFVFFRAASIGDAWLMLTGIAACDHLGAMLRPRLAYTVGMILLIDVPLYLTGRQTWALDWPLPLRVGLYSVLLASLIILGGRYSQPFIYFAF